LKFQLKFIEAEKKKEDKFLIKKKKISESKIKSARNKKAVR